MGCLTQHDHAVMAQVKGGEVARAGAHDLVLILVLADERTAHVGAEIRERYDVLFGPNPDLGSFAELDDEILLASRWIGEVHRFALAQLAERGDPLSRVAEHYQVRLAIVAAADDQERRDTGPCRACGDEELPT